MAKYGLAGEDHSWALVGVGSPAGRGWSLGNLPHVRGGLGPV
jgi:hypothetical protein